MKSIAEGRVKGIKILPRSPCFEGIVSSTDLISCRICPFDPPPISFDSMPRGNFQHGPDLLVICHFEYLRLRQEFSRV